MRASRHATAAGIGHSSGGWRALPCWSAGRSGASGSSASPPRAAGPCETSSSAEATPTAARTSPTQTRGTARDGTGRAAPQRDVGTRGVLLLTANTGGGHLASAEALHQELAVGGRRSRTIVLDPMTGPAAPRYLRVVS